MRASDLDLLIVPRHGGADGGDWPSRWLAKLSTAKFVAPDDPRELSRAAWIAAIRDAAKAATRPVLFVGHGLGAAAVVDAAPALKGVDVRGAVLVVPPDEDAVRRIAGHEWRMPRAKLPWPSLVVASRNDPDGSYLAVAALAADWGAELIDAGLAGGIDAASGHGPWPEGLMRLAGFLKKTSSVN
jgi:uncharacterized protein